MVVDKFLRNVSEEIGFKLGTPWRYNDKSLGVIVPILKIGNVEERRYVTLEEVRDKVTFKDTGHIDRVMVESSIGEPVFIRSGSMFKSGGTQPRAVETSTVIIPQEQKEEEKIPVAPIITKAEIPVKCIYASKGIRSQSKFSFGGDAPLEVRSALISRGGQSHVWKAVNRATHRCMASMSNRGFSQSSSRSNRVGFARSDETHNFTASNLTHDNLVGVMEEIDKVTPNLDEILKNVPLFEDQVGAIFLDTNDVIALEMFDHPKSWEAIHKEVEKRLGESATKEQESFYKPDYDKVKPLALEFLKKLLESKKTKISTHDRVSTFILKGNGVIGEVTTIDDKVIHMIGIKEDKKINDKIGDVTSSIRSARDIFSHMSGAAYVGRDRSTVTM